MKLKFYRCISLFLAVTMCITAGGCVQRVYSTNYKSSNVRPVQSPKKLFYVTHYGEINADKFWIEEMPRERKAFASIYPEVFSEKRTDNTIDLTISYGKEGSATFEGHLWLYNFATAIITGSTCGLSLLVLPFIDFGGGITEVGLSYNVGEDLATDASPIRTPFVRKKDTWREYVCAPLTAWFCCLFYDYWGSENYNRYDRLAAALVDAYNKNPTVFDGPEVEAYRLRKEKEAREKALEEARKKKEAQRQALENLDYYIVRQSFDAQTNIGTYRVQFKNKVPEVKELVQLQKDLLAFCYTKLRENNLEFDSRYVSVLQEDYRAIGKSLTLYEFTIKLGAVEFLDLQYDNSTLLGTISIRLPGGNPTNARKWVTENLDRLVEEYNISADNPIEGEYQLSSEKMSADGTYTVAFEVVN